jgi:hypothetical protein
MKIVFVVDSCFNIYRKRMYYNLVSLLGDRHDLQYIKPQKNLISKLKAMQPDILYLIVGGREHYEIIETFKGKAVTVADSYDGCDITINDEPEQVFPALVEALESGKDLSTVKGITYKQTTDKADKWDISTTKPISRNDSFLTFSTRGCKGQCSFCNVSRRDGSLRYRDIPEMIAEVKSFADIEGFSGHFRFADPSFDSNTPERMKEIARAIIRDLPEHTYEANFRPDFHQIADDELMNLLIESGLTTAFVGVESGNEEDLQLYNKGTTVSDAEKTIELFRRYDCFVSSGFINFNPFSTLEKLRENLDFLERNRIATYDNLKSRLTLSRGLPIKQTIIDEGLLYSQTYDVRNSMVKALMMILNDIERKLNSKAIELYSWLSVKEAKIKKRIAVFNDDAEAYAIADKYEKLIESVIMLESDLMAEWFRNILDMMDKGKPLTEIMAMSNRYINDEKLKVTIKYFKALESGMIRELNDLYDSRNELEKN